MTIRPVRTRILAYCVFIASACALPAAAADLYASPTGSGTTCSLASPCSLLQARDNARALIPAMSSDVVIHLLDGTYNLTAPLQLIGSLDSGLNGWNVVYQAEHTGQATLSGGRNVTGWVLHDVARNIWKASLTAPIPQFVRQVYVNNRRARRARSPFGVGATYEITKTGYLTSDLSLLAFARPSELEVVSFVWWKSFRCGVASVAPVGSPTPTSVSVTMKQPCWDWATWHPRAMEVPTWIENAYEYMGMPGEWYYQYDDGRSLSGTLYYVPLATEDLSTASVVVPVIETLVESDGQLSQPLHNVQFKGLTFGDATWTRPSTDGYPVLSIGGLFISAPPPPAPPILPRSLQRSACSLFMRTVHDLLFERNTFTRLGSYGLCLVEGAKSNVVRGNVFSDLSGGAIQIGDHDQLIEPADARLVSEFNEVSNNYVTNVGREFFDHVGINVLMARDTTIENNELHDLPPPIPTTTPTTTTSTTTSATPRAPCAGHARRPTRSDPTRSCPAAPGLQRRLRRWQQRESGPAFWTCGPRRRESRPRRSTARARTTSRRATEATPAGIDRSQRVTTPPMATSTSSGAGLGRTTT